MRGGKVCQLCIIMSILECVFSTSRIFICVVRRLIIVYARFSSNAVLQFHCVAPSADVVILHVQLWTFGNVSAIS